MHGHDERMPEPPECPRWCTTRHETPWDVLPGAVVRVCRRIVEVDGGAELVLERIASVENGRVLTDAPAVRMHVPDALSLPDAATLAETVVRLVEIVGEPSLAA